ncbi:hypothetical protein [Nonomuraea sp. NPDC049709]
MPIASRAISARAREHLQQARAELGAHGEDKYGLVKGGLERLPERSGVAG